MRRVLGIHNGSRPHWVGDGFPVRTIFSHASLGQRVSPFFLLDYAAPRVRAGDKPRGVGGTRIAASRPSRSSTGRGRASRLRRDGGVIGPGDVQWMTAASGVVHEELHEREFTRGGGTLEMVQLWVNLPAKDKNAPRRLPDALRDAEIPGSPPRAAAGACGSSQASTKGARGPGPYIRCADGRLGCADASRTNRHIGSPARSHRRR